LVILFKKNFFAQFVVYDMVMQIDMRIFDIKDNIKNPENCQLPKRSESGSSPDAESGRAVMSRKPVLTRAEARTVLNLNNEQFKQKKLCDGIVLNPGDLCVFSCSFCYAPSISRKLVHQLVKDFNQKQNHSSDPQNVSERPKELDLQDVIVRRENAVELCKKQLLKDQNAPKFADPHDNRVVFSSSLVDVGANMELLCETAALINLILDHTFWQIRLLSKGALLHLLIGNGLIPDKKKPGFRFSHHERLIFGFSSGTLDDGLARSFEAGLSTTTILHCQRQLKITSGAG
jgi:hypothetical protein